MKKLSAKILNLLPIGFLLLIVIIIGIQNYTPGTYLLGWDNLMPEFNFGLNISRSIQSVWEEYQGLGLLAGMAHASDLPHQIILLLSSVILPQSFLRYFYHFLMLAVGTIGIYVLLEKVILKNTSIGIKRFSSVLGALFYLLNLGTIQYFYVPFEPYSTFWGLFPWELAALFLFLRKPNKKTLIFFIIANLVAIPQAYVQTIFVVYLLCVVIILGIFILEKRTRERMLLSLKTLLIIFLINAFWILPNAYFVLTKVSVTENAIQNLSATQKFFDMNQKRGTLTNFPVLKEFYYDFYDYSNAKGQFDFLMRPWRDYNSHFPAITAIGYILFIFILLGLFRKNRYRKYIVVFFALSSLIFLSDTPPFSYINAIFRAIPIVNQIFRNPFTKFIVPTVMVFSLAFASGTEIVFTWLEKRHITFVIGAVVLLTAGIFTYSFPAFQGYFIAPQMRVTVPKEYFDLFSYLDKQNPNARIMNLPQGSYWGWEYYSWGARGSGFLWYGIPQPIMDRAFDVWSAELESYYWQLSYALNKKDMSLFNQILDKYNISYVLFDNTIIFTDSSSISSRDQQDMITSDPKISLAKSFGNISLYKVNRSHSANQNISLTSKLPTVNTHEQFSQQDTAYAMLGNYSSSATTPSFVFPFGSLFTQRTPAGDAFTVHDDGRHMIFQASVPQGTYSLHLPSMLTTENQLFTQVFASANNGVLTLKFSVATPKITVDNHPIPQPNNDTLVQIPLQNSVGPYYVSVNNQDYFVLGNLSSDFQFLGTTYLNNSALGNNVRVYQTQGMSSTPLNTQNFFPAHICGGITGKYSLSSTDKDGWNTLHAENTAACTVSGQSFSVDTNSLFQVSMTYKSKTDEFPQYCLYSQDLNGCLNKKDNVQVGFSNTEQKFTDFFEGPQVPPDTLNFQLILDATRDEDINKPKQISYKDVTLSSYPYVGGATIDLSTLTHAPLVIPVQTYKESKITISVSKYPNANAYPTPIKRNLFKTDPLNYDNLTQGFFANKTISTPQKGIELDATVSSSYLLLKAPSLPINLGYVEEVTSQHIEGFPLIINLFTNQNLRTYTYTLVPPHNTVNTSYFILPPLYSYDQGITTLLSSESYNNTPSINRVFDASLYPIPYAYMTSLYLSQSNNDHSAYKPIDGTKHSLYLYTVDASIKSPSSLILSQSYDKGWHAYIFQKNHLSFFDLYLPFIFGKKITDHSEVNGWENGWTLSPQTGSVHIVMIYLPQYLEYLGFILIPIALFLIPFRLKRTQKNDYMKTNPWIPSQQSD